jgi:hypothetical protein
MPVRSDRLDCWRQSLGELIRILRNGLSESLRGSAKSRIEDDNVSRRNSRLMLMRDGLPGEPAVHNLPPDGLISMSDGSLTIHR